MAEPRKMTPSDADLAATRKLGTIIRQQFVSTLLSLKKGLKEDQQAQAASILQNYIVALSFSEIAHESKALIGAYQATVPSSTQVFSTFKQDLQSFIAGLMREVLRRKQEDRESPEAINDFIRQTVAAFNAGEVDFELWVTEMARNTAAMQELIEEVEQRRTYELTRPHKRQLSDASYDLTEAKEQIQKLQAALEGSAKRLLEVERQKAVAAREHDDALDQQKKLFEEQARDMTQLRAEHERQKSKLREGYAEKIAELEEAIKAQNQLIESLQAKSKQLAEKLESASKPSPELSAQIASLTAELASTRQDLVKKQQSITEQEQRIASLLSERTVVTAQPAESMFNIELQKENEQLRQRIAELEAAAASKKIFSPAEQAMLKKILSEVKNYPFSVVGVETYLSKDQSEFTVRLTHKHIRRHLIYNVDTIQLQFTKKDGAIILTHSQLPRYAKASRFAEFFGKIKEQIASEKMQLSAEYRARK